MKKHLPRKIPTKQKQEIRLIAKELSKIKWVEKTILFWSFARWNFVIEDITEENKTTRCYKSDYDILIILKYYKKDLPLKISLELSRISKVYWIDRSINEVVEWINHINRMLEEKRYFYYDIVKEGILLFDTWKLQLSKPKKLSPTEKLKIQNEDFKIRFKSWDEFFIDSKNALNRWSYNNSAFYLHQSIERYVTTLLLVKTWYRPKTHDMKDFINFMWDIDDRFKKWFNLENKEEKRKFDLLRKAYVDARYSYNYRITKQELNFLEEKTLILKELVEVLCRQEIKKTEKNTQN